MKKTLNVIALILIVVGALNWGLWGFFEFDFVSWLFSGNTTGMSRFIYALIGLSGLWSLSFLCCCMNAVCCCKRDGGSCKSEKHEDK